MAFWQEIQLDRQKVLSWRERYQPCSGDRWINSELSSAYKCCAKEEEMAP